jgi:hypothetical protein
MAFSLCNFNWKNEKSTFLSRTDINKKTQGVKNAATGPGGVA